MADTTRDELQRAADEERLDGPVETGRYVDGAFGILHLRDKMAADLASYAPAHAALVAYDFTGANGYDTEEEDGEALDEHIDALRDAWESILAPYNQTLIMDAGDVSIVNLDELDENGEPLL